MPEKDKPWMPWTKVKDSEVQSFEIDNMFDVKDPIPRVRFTSFYVWAVMSAMSVKPVGIYPHA